MEERISTSENNPPRKGVWLKRFGIGAFLFFLIKGLIWLAAIFGLFKYIS